MARLSDQHGVLVVDKPPGPTSHDLVAQARRLYGTRAVGHAGTLDPLATGVMVLLVGEATKLSGWLTTLPKRYLATVSFGRSTDTLDAAGQVQEERNLPEDWLGLRALRTALDQERQRLWQQPPAFSAIKVGGRRAHQLSRRGQDVTLEPREVRVHKLTLVDADSQTLTVELSVSKGYYVRSFARDLGARLSVPAHLSALRRTASGAFTLDEAIAWPPPRPAALLPIRAAAERSLPVARLTEEGAARARMGRELEAGHFVEDPRPAHLYAAAQSLAVAWLEPEGDLVALGAQVPPDRFRVIRGFCSHQ